MENFYQNFFKQFQNMDIEVQDKIIIEREQLVNVYAMIEKKCQMIQEFEDPGMTNQQLLNECVVVKRSIAGLNLFSENQKIKEIHLDDLKFLALPYYMGFLYGRITKPRKQAITQSKNFLEAYIYLLKNFSSEQEQIFPPNLTKTWMEMSQNKNFALNRDQVIANHKQKKQIEVRYQNSIKLKEESDQRQSIKDFLTLKLYEAVTQIKNTQEEMKILAYKDEVENNEEAQKKHKQQLEKPVPKMKIWHIQKPEQIQQELVPPNMPKQRQEYVAQVWQQNANQPTMTLKEVAKLEQDNMLNRMEREKKQREANIVDTDSDKEEVDDREKKKAREWDDWKDANEKGAGNRGNR